VEHRTRSLYCPRQAFTYLHYSRGYHSVKLREVDARTGEQRTTIEERSDTYIDLGETFVRPVNGAHKYPVVESIYTGPQGFFVPKTFSACCMQQQAVAELGFVVVMIDGRGTAGRSKKFMTIPTGISGERTYLITLPCCGKWRRSIRGWT
jgi:dipeptidyl aminopeptidase/acylaminoacyl peptidase